jgi:hypothetical protein
MEPTRLISTKMTLPIKVALKQWWTLGKVLSWGPLSLPL